ILTSLGSGPAAHAAIEYQRLKSFGYLELAGGNQTGPLTSGSDGALYGTSGPGGTNDFGTVYKIQADGSRYTVLYRFPSVGNDGNYPLGGLVEGTDNALYGTTAGTGNALGT